MRAGKANDSQGEDIAASLTTEYTPFILEAYTFGHNGVIP